MAGKRGKGRAQAPREKLIEVCPVEADRYPLGQGPLAHEVTLSAFAIARTAVSNEQFAPFITAGGYHDESLWSALGWRWQQSKAVTMPAFWDDSRLNHAWQPVVGICWYEALAFTRWLARSTGTGWRLPTEAEWEAAARGHETQVRLNPAHVNSAEQGLGRTWSVFGNGAVSWCGAHDLTGNVWEWCSTRWGHNWQSLDYPYPYQADDGREDLDGSHARIMRGGSWFDSFAQAHPSERGRYLPGSRGSNIGFRLAHSL